jgi:hypothetical protein
MAIAGLAIGLLVPRIGAGWERMNDREFLSEFAGEMRAARLQAIHSGGTVDFRIRGGEKLYGFERPLENAMPGNVDIFAEGLQRDRNTGDFLVSFFGDGSIRGSSMDIVFAGERYYELLLDPIAGIVEVRRRTE